MNLSHLVPGDSPSRSSGAKFVIDGSFLGTYMNTSSWLKEVRALDLIAEEKSLRMSHKKILQGVLSRQDKKVVVKIADNSEDLKTEWDAYEALSKCDPPVPGFMDYFGFFRCKDTLARAIRDGIGDNGLCEGVGDTMQVLVMEHVDNQSMKRYDWTSQPIETLRSCLAQVICSLLEAHLACGFVHGDMHLDNILLKKHPNLQNDPSDAYVRYDRCDIGVPKGNLVVSIMDLELSKFGMPSRKFFIDLKTLFSKCCTDLINYVRISPFENCYRKINRWIDEDHQDPLSALDLVKHIELLEFADYIPRYENNGGGAQPRERKPRIGKKKRIGW